MPAVITTVWPVVILVLSRMMSVPDVPTVRPEITVVSLLSVMIALAAVPVSVADELMSGSKSKVKTPAEDVPDGSVKVTVAKILLDIVMLIVSLSYKFNAHKIQIQNYCNFQMVTSSCKLCKLNRATE